MHFSTSILLVAACLSVVVPVFSQASSDQATFTLYGDINFGGESETYDDPKFCHDVPNKLANDVSSLIVGPGIGCYLYSFPQCSGEPLGFYPAGSFPNLGPEVNDRAVSFGCVPFN